MARRLSKDDIISNIYYDLEKWFWFSIDETLKERQREQDPSINRIDVSRMDEEATQQNRFRRYRGF